MEKYLEELRRFDDIEHIFGSEFIDQIQYEEVADAYLVRIEGCEVGILSKDDDFEEIYTDLLAYLVYAKSQIFNHFEKGGLYYHDWCFFRVNYVIQKASFYLHISNVNNLQDVLQYLSEAMGRINCDIVIKLMNSPVKDYKGQIAYLFIYLGTVRALRDLALAYLDNDHLYGEYWAFQLWYMTPTFITDHFGYIFYIGNEMGKLAECPYNYHATEYYYSALYERIKQNISEHRQLTDQEKEDVIHQIEKEMKEDI